MDLEFSKEDYKKCILDTFGMPIGVDVMEAYPLLSKLSGFEYDFKNYPTPKMSKNKTIRYINYYYSKETPLNAIPDYKKRKAKAAIDAGFEYDERTGEFKPEIQAMLAGDDPMVNRMIVSFVAQNYSTSFSSLIALRDMYLRMLEDQTDPNKVAKVFEINEKMETLEHKLLNQDLSPKITAALIQRMEEIKLELRPEHIAQRIADGKNPIDWEAYA